MQRFIEIWSQYHVLYIQGTLMTLKISLFGVIFGTIIGMFLALGKLSKSTILKKLAGFYIEIIRGTPLLVQIMIVYLGLSYYLPDTVGFFKSRIFLGTLAICLNSAAYVAEIIRAGIESIDKGQVEAASSLGMNRKLTMRYIIIPQAIKNILPVLGNEFIVLIKETAIISMVGIQDLMYSATKVQGITYQPLIPFFIAALIYLTITFSLSKVLAIYERRLKTSD
ncbi:MAG: amino acid ABC transporter permease [Tissierellia bacterium]|nr:amino acid ABC transporter permease [Tissierellia bacterium]